LQYLIDNDKVPWGKQIPDNPNKSFWTMKFMGTEIFINVSHPNHKNRKSRNLCNALVLVINPRERFDHVGKDIRNKIRSNVDIYDEIARSPLLGHYHDGELEWPQYMLPDDNNSEPLECRLKFKEHVSDSIDAKAEKI